VAKTQTAIRFSAIGKRLLVKLAANLGVTQTAVMEMAVREMAKKQGVS